MYTDLRQNWLEKMHLPDNFNNLDQGDKFKVILNMPENVRFSAKYLVLLMDKRRMLNKDY